VATEKKRHSPHAGVTVIFTERELEARQPVFKVQAYGVVFEPVTLARVLPLLSGVRFYFKSIVTGSACTGPLITRMPGNTFSYSFSGSGRKYAASILYFPTVSKTYPP